MLSCNELHDKDAFMPTNLHVRHIHKLLHNNNLITSWISSLYLCKLHSTAYTRSVNHGCMHATVSATVLYDYTNLQDVIITV